MCTHQVRLDDGLALVSVLLLHAVADPEHRLQRIRQQQVHAVGAELWDGQRPCLQVRDVSTQLAIPSRSLCGVFTLPAASITDSAQSSICAASSLPFTIFQIRARTAVGSSLEMAALMLRALAAGTCSSLQKYALSVTR